MSGLSRKNKWIIAKSSIMQIKEKFDLFTYDKIFEMSKMVDERNFLDL